MVYGDTPAGEGKTADGIITVSIAKNPVHVGDSDEAKLPPELFDKRTPVGQS